MTQCEVERSTLIDHTFSPYAASVLINDLVDYGEADSCTFEFILVM